MKQSSHFLTMLTFLLMHTTSSIAIPQICDGISLDITQNNNNLNSLIVWTCRNWNTRASDGRIIKADSNAPNALQRWTEGLEKIITAAEKQALPSNISINYENTVCTSDTRPVHRDLEDAIIIASRLKGDSFRSLLPQELQARMITFEREIIKPIKVAKATEDLKVLPLVHFNQWPRNQTVKDSTWYNGKATIK